MKETTCTVLQETAGRLNMATTLDNKKLSNTVVSLGPAQTIKLESYDEINHLYNYLGHILGKVKRPT